MDRARAVSHKNLLFAALGDLIRYRLRSLVVFLCLTAILFPLVTALSISEGLRFQAEIAIQEGADAYLSQDICSANGPIPSRYLDRPPNQAEGFRAAARVIGRTYFVDRLVAVVGLEEEGLSALRPLVRGDIPRARGDVVVGQGLAKAFDLQPGPGMRFTVSANHRKVFKPTGILRPSCLWSSDILVMHLEDANAFFRMEGWASQILLHQAPGSESAMAAAKRDFERWGLTVETRDRLEKRLRGGYRYGDGIFIVLSFLGVALAIPIFLLTSGIGLREARREIGILRATGWSAGEVLEKITLENLLLCLAAASLSILLSMAWMKGLNGAVIAQFYVAEVGVVPSVEIPSRYLPSHALFCLLFGWGVTGMGALSTAWWRMRAVPGELMR